MVYIDQTRVKKYNTFLLIKAKYIKISTIMCKIQIYIVRRGEVSGQVPGCIERSNLIVLII